MNVFSSSYVILLMTNTTGAVANNFRHPCRTIDLMCARSGFANNRLNICTPCSDQSWQVDTHMV